MVSKKNPNLQRRAVHFTLKFAMVSYIGGGTGGPHGPRPPHFYFWGDWPPTFLPKYRKFK